MSCLSCSRRKTQSPSPPGKNLPPNMLREIAKHNSEVRRVLSKATTLSRRQTPIGLAVTKVGPPVIPRNRPPPINRSVAKAKPEPRSISKYLTGINKFIPIAYKNKNWKSFAQLNRSQFIFFNKPNGIPFMFHKKTGARIPLKPRAAWVLTEPGGLEGISRHNRRPRNTWNAYTKRAYVVKRTLRGKAQQKHNVISNAIQRFKTGNQHALNSFSVPNLAWWSLIERANRWDRPFYIQRGGQWRRSDSRIVVTKNDILNNIKSF